MRPTRRFLAAAFAGLVVFATACTTAGSDTDADPTTTLPDATVATTTTSAADVTTTTTGEDPADDVPTLAELREDRGVAVFAVNASDGSGGPYPMLSWQPVSDATAYWLVVSDSDGQPYWTWTGADTEVRFGGGESTEVNQTATLHEPMTWTVIAIGAEGQIVAFSPPTTIEP